MGQQVRRPTEGTVPLTTDERLSMLMADRGMTSRELAESLGIQESTLANFRRGYRGVPSDIISEMARELGTNVPFLLKHSEDARPSEAILEDARAREEAHRRRVSPPDTEV